MKKLESYFVTEMVVTKKVNGTETKLVSQLENCDPSIIFDINGADVSY